MTKRKMLERELLILRQKQIRKARKSLWDFCQVESPDFYNEDEWHLKIICFVLEQAYRKQLTKQAFYKFAKENAPQEFIDIFEWDRLEDDKIYTRVMVNIPPRLGKSRTLVNFTRWALGKDNTNKVITASYNDDIATDFSRYTRDGIQEGKTYPHEIVYTDIFPETRIKYGDASYKQWALEGQFFSYKGSGVGGSVTGKGCNISIVDDAVKSAEDAYNENALNRIWTWYTGTFLSRLEENGIEIMNMTRWAKKDPCGRILDGEEAAEWFVLRLEARLPSGKMLSPANLGEKRYLSLSKTMDEAIFNANYHQKPLDIKGRLYSNLKTYEDIPRDETGRPIFEEVRNYTDTADTGSDYLCHISYGKYQGQAYIIDVYYTKEGMAITEEEAARRLVQYQVNVAKVESNNGGGGYARNLERILWEKYETRAISIEPFHQSKNKQARILSNSSNVMNNAIFPIDWKNRWPAFYRDITEYQKEGKNKHDDAPDALTGVIEEVTEPSEILIG